MTTSFNTTTPIPSPPQTTFPPIQCWNQEDYSEVLEYFYENLPSLQNSAPIEIRTAIIATIILIVSIGIIFRHVAVTDQRNEKINTFLRSKGVINDNRGNVVLQPLSTISYNMIMFVFRVALFATLLFPSTSSPSTYPRDYFAPLAQSFDFAFDTPFGTSKSWNFGFPQSCVYQPKWFGTLYVCIANTCDPRRISGGAASNCQVSGNSIVCPSADTADAEGRGFGCKACGMQFPLPDWFYEDFPGSSGNATLAIINRNSKNNHSNENGGGANLTYPNATTMASVFYTTMHEDPMIGPAFIIGVCGTILQIVLEWYFNKRFPEQRRKLRAVSVSLLNYYDFIEHMTNPQVTFYKEFDWKFVGVGILVQATSFFTPCIYLFSSYATVSILVFWPLVFLCTMACWDIAWLLFVLIERRTDDEGKVIPFTDFDPQLKLLTVTNPRLQQQFLGVEEYDEIKQEEKPLVTTNNKNNENDDVAAEVESTPLGQEVKQIEKEEEEIIRASAANLNQQQQNEENEEKVVENPKSLASIFRKDENKDDRKNENTTNKVEEIDFDSDQTKLTRLPKTLDELLPRTKARTWRQCHEVFLIQAFAFFFGNALIKFAPGSFVSPLISFAFALPFFILGAFWRTRNSFKLVANDDGTLTLFLEKISSCGITIEIDITNALLRGACRLDFINPNSNAKFYEENKIDPSIFLMANFYVDRLSYQIFLHPGSEEKVVQQLMWLQIVVQNSHRDLYTSENTADVPRKQLADTRLSSLVTFAGRALQSEDLLNLALRLDTNNNLAKASLHAMTKEKRDPGSLGFERRRGDRLRLSLRCFQWTCALYATFSGLLIATDEGFIKLLRTASGGGSFSCVTTFSIYSGMISTKRQDDDNLFQPVIVALFPHLMYVGLFVFTLLIAVHLDMIYRKRVVLESPFLIRLQAAGGIFCALQWPSIVNFVIIFTTTDLGILTRDGVLGIFIWKSILLEVAIVGPILGLLFPIVS